ncbi:hypothetical protein [Halorubrum vacuolatum]|uniref:hypothetical protein n=1 Tax=Halorubrum vacuolatum TaxID=63740 RepID=UPI000B780734|nr:hypothetical protein [Halorubrum vacuolatum]
MKQTGLFHLAATAAVGVGILVSDQLLTAGLLILGLLLFVAGIVIARRDDGDDVDTPDGTELVDD